MDPSRLPPGLHYGEVVAHELEARGRGPLFRLPVTLIKPLAVPLAATAYGAGAGGATAAAATPAVAATASGTNGNGGNGSSSSVGTVSLGPLGFTAGSEFRCVAERRGHL